MIQMVLEKKEINSSANKSAAIAKETSISDVVISGKKFNDNVPNDSNSVPKERTIGNVKHHSNDLEFLLDEDNLDDIYIDPYYVPSCSNNSDPSDTEELEQMGRKIEEGITTNDLSEDNMNNATHNNNNRSYTLQTSENVTSRKRKRNFGKEYVTKKGTVVKARQYKELGNCRRNCKTKISVADQEEIFQTYWQLGSHTARLQFLNNLTEVKPKKTERLNKVSSNCRNRTHSNYYFFEKHGNRIAVCQKCFKDTLCETEQILETVVKKKLESSLGAIEIDRRGRHPPSNKLSEQKIEEIRQHINKFPTYESHYTRNRSSQKYLQSDLSISQMCKMYFEECEHPA